MARKPLERVTSVALDLTDPAAPELLVRRAVDEFGRIDVLVNNLGSGCLRLEVHRASLPSFPSA